MATAKDYTRLKSLLETQETFPLQFIHKFIGRNTPDFALGVESFERKFPKAQLKTARTSKGDAHLALTYVFEAASADEVVHLFQATDLIRDLLIVL